ncbi:hypothetical protein JOF35_003545 [Streptomyces demainii]|uniref:Uncharacterized protein n=1 Tax=Streptomyces demainii TaxID=588122 RepID=A0ABT9KS49_9ACTN|nr:hypothetical protein [Streptomyces demainii]
MTSRHSSTSTYNSPASSSTSPTGRTTASANARPLHPLPTPIDDRDTLTRRDIRRHDHRGSLLRESQRAVHLHG